ncbi:uncharacterized protein EDB91DRAFT_558422 [Suillus paluster]|uniref:uncharacterized protein n=1 Tax=Suillus paluster TaxID=48578 RepID=UPI001B8849A7|nr:uncharacterized protein EDB91DRAFT_558422 [Suillus paluster]KAG1735646.1 hypothetical protein EDB91DRAFT_558422 [Suillus paluster]
MHFEFPWLKDLCKVIAIRLRRPTKNRRKRGLTDTDHEGDGSIPAGIPIAPPSPSPTLPSNPSSSDPISVSAPRDPCLEVSANISSSKYSVSLAREASDMAQFALPFVQAFADVIPLVGAPTKAAIGGLLEVLQAIDVRACADLDSLKLRLHQLGHHLCNAPPPRDPLEQSRRDSIVRVLEETSAQLTKLHKCRRLVYASVTQVIARCSTAIDRYLLECLWTSQMQSQNDIREMKDLIIRTQFSVGPSPMQSIGTFALSCVTLVDATGHEHPVLVNFCTSFQQLNDMLQVLFKRESIEARIQRRYIEEGHYYLCIDEGTEVTRLTSDEWSTIEAGTKIVMRVIIEQQMTSSLGVSYKCHFCGAENHLGLGSIMYSLRRRAGCSIDCRECKRRFQISRKYLSAMESTQCSNIDSNHTADPEMLVIRNFHVQQTVYSS